jgi:monovalent cation/proton antiporter MnhG/PhaG subunit
MSVADLTVDIFLGIAVGLTAISCWALLLFKDLFERLHYLSAVTTISTFALLVAVVIKEGWGQAAIKTILVLVVLLLVNAVLSHATARAARVHQFGDWLPHPEEHVEGAQGGQ